MYVKAVTTSRAQSAGSSHRGRRCLSGARVSLTAAVSGVDAVVVICLLRR